MTEPHFSINFTARVLPVSNAVAKGDVLVFSSAASYQGTTGWWVVASSANRATADSRAQAIALTAYGGSAIGTVTYQSAGVVATEISGLAATTTGTYKLVRVSSAGRLERITSYTSGDDVVGYAYPDGRVALHIGLPWEFIASLAGNITGRRVVYGNGVLAGAENVRISTDGYLTFGDDPASAGDARHSSGGYAFVKGSGDTTEDLCVWQHIALNDPEPDEGFPGSPGLNTLFVGGFFIPGGETGYLLNIVGAARLRSGKIFEYRSGTDIVDDPLGGHFGAWGPGAYTASPTSKGFYCGPNLYVSTRGPGFVGLDDAFEEVFKGGVGLLRLDAMRTAPSGSPNAGFFLRSKPTTFEPQYLLPGDNPSTGWRDLASSETTVNVTSATPGDIAITSATRVVNCDATDMIIRGFTKPTTPAAGVISITNSNASPITVDIGNPVSAGNGVGAPVSPGTTLSIPENSALTVSYDYNATAWVAHYGVTTNVP